MRRWKRGRLAAAGQIVVLAGCVPTAMAPTVTATPGPGKLPAVFASDHAACTAQANKMLAPVVQAANNQVAGATFLNVMTGTGPDAVGLNAQATTTAQQQYDAAYSQCMYAMGDNVPPYYMQPVAYAEPVRPTHRAKRRVASKPAATTAETSAPSQGFVVPAPAATPAAGSSFITPAPTSGPAASAQFAVPPAHP